MFKKILTLSAVMLLSACQPLSQMTPMEVLTAVGTASISAQDGKTLEEKRFKAIKASKLEAYRELSEQIYGFRVSGEMEIDKERLGIDKANGEVDGIIRGAEVIASYPVGDSYVTEMRLDLRKMKKMMEFGEVQSVPRNTSILF
ncbi:flagellar biosynthesis protein FlgP [Veronia nyctiphanis]|uniref:Flagellar biosynthesis protein FlgP n=1 Tax=Veronia nyctiphanis TaxID=1278244 RepID=A0A4Q0YPD9_9GAMM|nr:LPP20 family lipoprotein [Veronia nyctiphanis]RXJ72890.1 flagellar biosynthesis protein FlgP [Veronia nyctiphanis]